MSFRTGACGWVQRWAGREGEAVEQAMARKVLSPVGTCPEDTGASLEGHLLAKCGITGTSELAMRSSPWEKGGASVTPWCVLTQEAPQKSAEGAVEWEVASLLIGPRMQHTPSGEWV